jgi:hypothetical protein
VGKVIESVLAEWPSGFAEANGLLSPNPNFCNKIWILGAARTRLSRRILTSPPLKSVSYSINIFGLVSEARDSSLSTWRDNPGERCARQCCPRHRRGMADLDQEWIRLRRASH